MILGKTIILKGVAGVAAVGGLATTGYIYKDKIASSLKGSPKENEAANNQGNNADSQEVKETVQNDSTGQAGNGKSGQAASITQPGTAAPNGQASTDLASNGQPGAGGVNNVIDTNHRADNQQQEQVQHLSTDDERDQLGFPKSCKLGDSDSSKTCSITKEDLAKIEFSNRNGVDLTVEGMTDGQNITLEITKMNDGATYTNGKKYTFKGFTETIKIKVGESLDNVITLKGNEENDFKENSEKKLEKVPKKVLDEDTINKLNEKLKKLGLPEGCDFNKEKEENEPTAIVCEIKDLENLKKIKFIDKTGNKELKTDDDGELDNLKLKIKKLINEEKTSFGETLEDDLLFIFDQLEATIKWNDDSSSIFLPDGSNAEFKLSEEKLSKLWTPTSLGQKVGLTCDDNNKECTIPNTLSFKKGDQYHKNISMSSASNGKFKFEKDEENCNQGFKYTYEGDKVTLGSDPQFTLSNNDSFEIKYDKDNGWYLSSKT